MSAFELNSSWRNTYPYTAIVHLVVQFPGGTTSGTGALVGKNDILTATHVVYSPELGGYPTKIHVSFGSDWNGVKWVYDESPKHSFIYERGEFGGIAFPSGAFVDASHTTMRGSESQHDVAIIAIPDPIGLEVGWFGMATGRDSPRTSNSVGYPGTGSGMMYEQVRVVAHPFLDIYYANTGVMAPGASGGPLFDSDNYIIGVRSSGSSTSATWADLDLHYNELVDYIASNDDFLDKNRIITLTATASAVDEGEQITFKLFDSTSVSGEQARYEMSGLTSADISLANLGGYLTFGNDGFATLSIKIAKDNRTEGRETLIFASSGKVAEVFINDTSTMQNQQDTLITDVSPPRNIDGSYARTDLVKILSAHDNSVYVVGGTNSDALSRLYDHAKYSLFVSRYSSEGELFWRKSFGSYEMDYAETAVLDNADNIYVLSRVGSSAPDRPELGINDVLLTKLNNKGALVWEKVYGGKSSDSGLVLQLGLNGMLNLEYVQHNAAAKNSEYIQLTIDLDGNTQNSSVVAHSTRSSVFGFDGSKISINGGYLFSYAANGALQWKTAMTLFDGNGDPIHQTGYGALMALGIDGSIYVTATTYTYNGGNEYLQKYSSDGVRSWVKEFGATAGSYTADGKTTSDYMNTDSITVSNNGSVFIGGRGEGSGFYDIPSSVWRQVWYASFDQDGNNLSSKAFDGREAPSIAVSQNGDVLLGISEFGGGLNYTKINSTENNPATVVIENSQSMITEGGTAQFKIISTNLAEGTEVGYGVWLSGGEVLSTKGVVTLDANGEALINVTSIVDNKYDIDTSLVVTTMFGSSGIFVRDATPLSGDENYAIRTDDIGRQAYRIYEAAFNRDPDPRGLGYWISQFDNGMGLIEVSSRFIDSNEFKAIYGTNPTNATFITNLYLNVLDRAPDDAGLDWWVDQLENNSEKTWQKVLADFSESPENIENNRVELVGGVEYISYDLA